MAFGCGDVPAGCWLPAVLFWMSSRWGVGRFALMRLLACQLGCWHREMHPAPVIT